MIQVDDVQSGKIANMSFLCAVMVVFIHLPPNGSADLATRLFYSFFGNGICNVAIPFFFAASGYFLARRMVERGWWLMSLSKRFRTLYLPMVIWNCLWFSVPPLIAHLVRRLPIVEVSLHVGVGDVLGILAMHPFQEPCLGVLWFIRSLLVMVILSPFLRAFANPIGVLFLYCLQGVVGPSLGGLCPPVPFTLLKGFFPVCGAAAFVFGMMLHLKSCSLVVPTRGRWLALVALLITWGCAWFYPQYRSFFKWASTPWLLVAIWSICPARRFPKILLQSTFPLYLMHMFFVMIIWCTTGLPATLLDCLAQGAFVVGGCVVLSAVIRLVLPRLSSVLFGGR